MDYHQIHFLNWLKARPCLSLECIETSCDMPKGTMRHFLKERRGIPVKFFDILIKEMALYGYRPIDSE